MPSDAPFSNIIAFPARQSFGKSSQRQSVTGQVIDLTRFYADFQGRWQAFLHAHFDGPVAVAYHFGVTERAAEKWWSGIGGPRGGKEVIALMTVPGAADYLLRAA